MKIIPLIISVFIAQAAGVIGSLFTTTSLGTWYVELSKPSWNPPSWVFGPVWITLYTLMGIASYLVWQRREIPVARTALVIYGVHLVFNTLWSILFFGLQNPGFAFFEIIVLLGFISATIFLFWKASKLAGVLLLPYLFWVSFAAFLNYTIWRLN